MTIRPLILQESQQQYQTVEARTVLKSYGTYSHPVKVSCSDNQHYVIKGSQNGKALYNEYVCGRLGNLLTAAVAWVQFVELSNTLRMDAALQHFGPGLALGSLVVQSVVEKRAISHIDVPANRSRHASLALLYSWCRAGDHQLLYEENPPYAALSNDHGFFFPNGPNWDSASLAANGAVMSDPWFAPCALTPADFTPYWPLLAAITDQEIHQITGAPPLGWGVTPAERTDLANYLIARRGLVEAAF